MENYTGEGPIYQYLKDCLKKRILDEYSLQGDKIPTLAQLKDEYGVSILTVKRAVDELAKINLVQPVRKKGILINKTKVAELKSISSNINVVVVFQEIFNINGTALHEIIKGIGEEANAGELTWEIFNIQSKGKKLADAPLFLKSCDTEKKKCGVILASRMNIGDVLLLMEKKIPFVWINDYLPHEPIHSVMTDKGRVYSLLLSHLKQHNYRHVGIIDIVSDPVYAALFQEFSIAMGIVPEPVIFEGKSIDEYEEKKWGAYHAEKILKKGKLPEALICAGDLTTMGAIEVFQKKGVRIPEDLALMSVLNSRESVLRFPFPLSTVVNPYREMAKESLKLLISLINGGTEAAERKFISPYFIPGISCGCKKTEKP